MPETYRKLIATTLTPHFREAAELVEESVPEPGPGQLLVRNRYAGVNATDVNITAGRYSANPSFRWTWAPRPSASSKPSGQT